MLTNVNSNLTNVVTSYLQKLDVKITKRGLSKQLEENPYFPSLYSIKTVLDKYKIPNEAFSVEANHLDQLEPPFIAYSSLSLISNDFILVTNIGNDTVSYISDNRKEQKVPRSTFLAEWQKIVLVAEPDGRSIEPDYKKNLDKEHAAKKKSLWLWNAGIFIVALVLLQFFLKTENSSRVMAGLIGATKVAGCTFAVLLLIYEIDSKNSFVKKLCTAGLKTDCDAILNSKASGIAGLKWSEAGFFYFSATLLFLFNPSITFAQKIPWLAIGATVVSPYILFSIYYQYRIAKQWCSLCLAVQAVLLAELVWAIIAFRQHAGSPSLHISIILPVLISILLPIVVWYTLKPFLKKTREFAPYKAAYRRLLYNPEQFEQLLKQQPQAHEGWQSLGINVGNPDAKNCIVKVCNPYCAPCAEMHALLEEVIRENDNIKLKIIFTATNSETDRRAKPVKHLLAIAARNNMQLTQQALHDWYGADVKNYESFAADYPMNGELLEQDEKIDRMSSWCNKEGIKSTPTIFINGRVKPEDYNISELKNIL